MPKPSEYMPTEAIEGIWKNLDEAEENLKNREYAVADAKRAGIDVLGREEKIKADREWLRRMRAVYGRREDK